MTPTPASRLRRASAAVDLPAQDRPLIESLEGRRLLAAIEGFVFEDINGDGVKQFSEPAQVGVTVFIDTDFDRQLDDGEISTTSDANGAYIFDDLPAPGTYYIAAVPPEGQAQTSPGINGLVRTGATGLFDIDVEFIGNVGTEEDRQVVLSAAQRWEQIIIGDLPDVNLDFDDVSSGRLSISELEITDGQPIDDILLKVSFYSNPSDGLLGSAIPLAFREDDGLPYLGEFRLNLATISNPAEAFDTTLHEMAHALGFTAEYFQSLPDLTSGVAIGPGGVSQGRDPRFLGPNATREYNTIFGVNEFGVPLENIAQVSHLRESVFEAELMTPQADFGRNFLSRVTIGVMDDIGYEVNYDAADLYNPPNNGGGGTTLPFNPAADTFGRPFVAVVTLPADDPVTALDESRAVGVGFGHRPNGAPSIGRLDATALANDLPRDVAVAGTAIRLDAIGPSDPDSARPVQDQVTGVTFYQESNGIEGLQTRGLNQDTYLAFDDSIGRFRVVAVSPNAPGTSVTYYAKPYDRTTATGDVKSVTVDLVAPQTPPIKPLNLALQPLSTDVIRVEFDDRSDDEVGFRLQVSETADFSARVRDIFLDPNENVVDVEDLDPATNYYFRVRSYNTAGSSTYTGRPTTTTLAPGELLIDFNEAGESRVPGNARYNASGFTRVENGDGLFGDYLAGGSFATVNPFVPVTGEYFLFARNPSDPSLAGNVDVTVAGRQTDRFSYDLADARGGYTLLGKVDLVAGSGNTIVLEGTNLALDALRLLPVA